MTSNLKRQLFAEQGDKHAVAGEITKLLAAFPRRDDGTSELTLRVDAYFDAVEGAPLWAVRQARLRVVRGEVGSLDTRFAPAPAQFAGIVRDTLKPLRDDLLDLEKLSEAVAEYVPTPAEKARVAQGFEDLKRSLPTGKAREAKTEAALAAMADGQLRQRLRDNGMSEEEVEATMASLKPAEPRPGSFTSLNRAEEAA